MSSAGQLLIAGRIPGERIETDIQLADSGTFTTTETTVQSVTASLVTGRTYRVRFHGAFQSTVANDEVVARIREDNSTGTELNSEVKTLNHANSLGHKVTIEAEYTAAATADKTFVLAAARAAGTGNLRLEAQGNRPSYLYVDYIEG